MTSNNRKKPSKMRNTGEKITEVQNRRELSKHLEINDWKKRYPVKSRNSTKALESQ